MRKRSRMLLTDEGTENFWPSFTDLISTVSMILFVLVLLAYIQNLLSSKQLSAVRAELGASAARLATANDQLRRGQAQLRTLSAEIRAGQEQLALSQAQVEQQRNAVSASNAELSALRSKVEGIAVLRVDMLQRVKQSIDSQLKPAAGSGGARISDNGNITIDESLVFEVNAYQIRPSGKTFLQALAKAFANVLAAADVRQNIDVVLVQGHTDERGSVAYNRELSAKRANAVLDYMFESEPELEHDYGSYFAASAYSEFRPVNPAKTEVAYQQNRRIEISVVLKDAGIRNVIDDYMHNQDPMFQAKPQP
jgi:chemotaxis protein MotB